MAPFSKIRKRLSESIQRLKLKKRGVIVAPEVKGIGNVRFEGKNAVLSFCNFNGQVKVGYGTTFSIHNLIHGDIEIGKYCQFGPYASINTFNHPTTHITTYINQNLLDGQMSKYKTSKLTRLGNDIWIGKNAIILGGITLGNGVIVAAGSVVTKDVPDYHIVAGVPAKVIKKRFSNKVIDELNELKWWDKSENALQEMKQLFDKDLEGMKSIYDLPSDE